MDYKIAGVVLLSSMAAAVALAATPQELQKKRHDHYHELGDAFKAVRDGAKASAAEKFDGAVEKRPARSASW